MISDLRKKRWWKPLMRFLRFIAHFFIVNLLLFTGAVGFAYIEDPQDQTLRKPLINTTTDANGKYVSTQVFADGNSTMFFLYMSQHFNVSINEESQEDFLKAVSFYNEAITENEKLKIYAKGIHDRWLIFTKWFYFVTIASTTIGYGDVAPKTFYGRIFYIVFSIVGIPVMMTLLASCGDIMTLVNKSFFSLLNKYLCKGKKMVSEELLSAISILILLVCYVTVGCVYTISAEKWTVVDSIYFWIVTFTTVGFGDVVMIEGNTQSYIIPVTLYRCFGLALLAGCIDSLLAWGKTRQEYFRQQSQKIKRINLLEVNKKRSVGSSSDNSDDDELQRDVQPEMTSLF